MQQMNQPHNNVKSSIWLYFKMTGDSTERLSYGIQPHTEGLTKVFSGLSISDLDYGTQQATQDLQLSMACGGNGQPP